MLRDSTVPQEVSQQGTDQGTGPHQPFPHTTVFSTLMPFDVGSVFLENLFWFSSEKIINTWVKVGSEFKRSVCLFGFYIFMVGFSFCSYTPAANSWGL